MIPEDEPAPIRDRTAREVVNINHNTNHNHNIITTNAILPKMDTISVVVLQEIVRYPLLWFQTKVPVLGLSMKNTTTLVRVPLMH